MWNKNAPQGLISCAILTKLHRVCTLFQDALVVKILLDLLKGLWSYGGFKLRGSGCSQIFSDPSGETMHQTLKRFGGARTCTMPSLVGFRISPAIGVAKNVEFFCLSVCLFVCPSRFWMSEFVHPILPRRRWSTETILMPIDRGRFVVVHPCSTFWDWCQLATSLNAAVPKTAKISKNWGFLPSQDDRIKRLRRNFAGRRVPRVCYSSPNLALIGKRGLVQEPPKMSKFAQNCGFWPPEADTTNTFR